MYPFLPGCLSPHLGYKVLCEGQDFLDLLDRLLVDMAKDRSCVGLHISCRELATGPWEPQDQALREKALKDCSPT